MGEHSPLRRRILPAAVVAALAGLVAACAGDPKTAAPVTLKGAAPEAVVGRPAAPPAAAPTGKSRQIVVRRGQSLGGIARDHRVPQRTIIAANRLTPPYKIEAGQRLVIPGAADLPVRREADPAVRQEAAAARPAPAASAPGRAKPQIIPLDGPEPAPAPAPKPADSPQIAFPQPARPTTATQPAEEPAAEKRAETAPQSASAGGRHFPWPVRGRVLAAYGASQGGGHNDGINIAAPRGAAIRAVDAGVVAYAGNEVRGYGNLVLIKHSSGLISAYAHCEELLVKRGDKISRGQVIAKVGATGGVTEPQLHFELRRGKRPVDPREFLAPAPSAGSAVEKRS